MLLPDGVFYCVFCGSLTKADLKRIARFLKESILIAFDIYMGSIALR